MTTEALGPLPERIVSGGQTGVDRAALDVARDLGLALGGRCPKGRWAEDGVIPSAYPLEETASREPAERTRLNVLESDATLILSVGPAEGGTRLTAELAAALGRPHLVVDLDAAGDGPEAAATWLARVRPRVLNVAGPRESRFPGVHARAIRFLTGVAALMARPS